MAKAFYIAKLTTQIVVLLVLVCGTAGAAGVDSLYRAQAVVTGRGEANRAIGLALCLEDVLVKVSGDPRLIGDPRVKELAAKAATFASAFRYRDRYSGRPIHDEQGSYDRPHHLTVDFDPVKIDALLKSLGREPWLSQRPRMVVFLDVRPRKGPAFTLVGDSNGEREADMRASLAAAAERVGLPMALPAQAELTRANQRAAGAALKGGDGIALFGNMVWSDEALGWVVDWRMDLEGSAHQWQIRSVGFDDAFRNGVRGAAQVLSGNGRPD
jgi:hypothetical protein